MRVQLKKKIVAVVDIEVYFNGKVVAYVQPTLTYPENRSTNLVDMVREVVKENTPDWTNKHSIRILKVMRLV